MLFDYLNTHLCKNIRTIYFSLSQKDDPFQLRRFNSVYIASIQTSRNCNVIVKTRSTPFMSQSFKLNIFYNTDKLQLL